MTPPTQFIAFGGTTVVSDAWVCVAGLGGTSSNGTYLSQGNYNGRRYYEKDVGGSPYYIYWVDLGSGAYTWAWNNALGGTSPIDQISATPDLHPYGGGTGTFVSDSGGTVVANQCVTTTTTTTTTSTSTSTTSTSTTSTSTTSTSTSTTSTSTTSTSTSTTSTTTSSTTTSSTTTSTTTSSTTSTSTTTTTTTTTTAPPSTEYLCVSGGSGLTSPSPDGTYTKESGTHNGYEYWAYDAGGTTYWVYYDTSDSRWELGSIYDEANPKDSDDGGIYPYSGNWGTISVSSGTC